MLQERQRNPRSAVHSKTVFSLSLSLWLWKRKNERRKKKSLHERFVSSYLHRLAPPRPLRLLTLCYADAPAQLNCARSRLRVRAKRPSGWWLLVFVFTLVFNHGGFCHPFSATKMARGLFFLTLSQVSGRRQLSKHTAQCHHNFVLQIFPPLDYGIAEDATLYQRDN